MQHTRTFTPVHHSTRAQVAGVRGAGHRTSPYTKFAKKLLKRCALQLLIYFTLFFVIPSTLPSGADAVLLTLIFPTACTFMAAMYGNRYGFISHYLAIPAIMFIIASFIYFPPFTFIFALCNLLVGFVGLTFGTVCRQSAPRRK